MGEVEKLDGLGKVVGETWGGCTETHTYRSVDECPELNVLSRDGLKWKRVDLKIQLMME